VAGPLTGIRVVELAGLGPAPFAGMMLADMGADVVRIDRPEPTDARPLDPLKRGRRSITVDLKQPEGKDVVLRLCAASDALIEGYRPGVAERLGIGPDECLGANPRLVYGRMTGWGQEGPYAQAAGHDINYISLTGALAAIGSTGGPPVAPLNLVGDFGGGGMLLAFGVVCGVLEAQRSGQGQVIDAAMVDGASLLMGMMYGFRARGEWELARGANRLDGGAPYYGIYECADGKHVSVGPLEPQFYKAFVEVTGADPGLLDRQPDKDRWAADREHIAGILATKTRDEWAELFEGVDACVAPILDMEEAAAHPHNVARGTYHVSEGVVHPSPAPRFSRTTPEVGEPYRAGAATADVLRDAGFAPDEIDELVAANVVGHDQDKDKEQR
jgi:alpha-methylacyl-CoA racemase